MIEVTISYHHQEITQFVISGHANYSTEMMDVVCAQVSAIGVGILNTIDEICNASCKIQMKSGYIDINVNQSSETLQIILKTAEIQLMTVAHTNYEYIKITKAEV